ncbi:MAG: hypothetical protein R6U17_09390 [Thermoplasmata archaeon]
MNTEKKWIALIASIILIVSVVSTGLVSSLDGAEYELREENEFLQESPSINLTSPAGGEEWYAGDNETITWNTTQGNGTITHVDLRYSSDGGASWSYIAEEIADTGAFIWTVPDVSTQNARVRATVHDNGGLSGVNTSEIFFIVGSPPEPPRDLIIEHFGLAEVLDNGIFEGDYEHWNLTRIIDGGEARWDNESYVEGGSLYVMTETEGEGNFSTEHSYWEQNITPVSEEITLSGAFRKNVETGLGLGWETHVHNATVEILVHDTTGWYSVHRDDEISLGYTNWTEFDPVSYTPDGEVDAVQVRMHVEAEGDTGPLGNDHPALGELWMDHISVLIEDPESDEHNLISWNASSDDPDTVVEYEVYRSDKEDGIFENIITIDADGSTNYTYVDRDKGMADNVYWWYIVHAVDIYDQPDGNENAVREPSSHIPLIRLTRPTGGEEWHTNDIESIMWNTTQGEGAITHVDLEISPDAGTTWTYIAEGINDTGSYNWIVFEGYTTEALIRATVYDDEGLERSDVSGEFSITDPPAPPQNLSVEHYGIGVYNGIFEENYEPWTLTRIIDEGEARWDNESYLEGGSIYIIAEDEGEGNISTEHSYWEQSITPTSSEMNLSGVFRKNIFFDSNSGAGWSWETHVHHAVFEVFVHDTAVGWQTVYMDNDTSLGDTGWMEFDSNLYEPEGFVNRVRVQMHVEAEGDTGPLGGEHAAFGELWLDQIIMLAEDPDGNEHNIISWDASPDDPGSIVVYNVYRSEDENGTFENIATIDVDGSAYYTYVDLDKGMADDTYWWYVVQATDVHGQSDGNLDAVQEPPLEVSTFQVNLYADANADGWNFISFNLIPVNSSLESILETPIYGITGSYDRLMYYDGTANTWYTYIPDRPEHFNSLDNWNHQMGIWIRMTENDTLTIKGSIPARTSITLEPGWNMISIPSSEAGNHNIPAEITRVGYFQSSAEYNIVYTDEVSNFEFNPGDGYWIYNSANVSVHWIVDY